MGKIDIHLHISLTGDKNRQVKTAGHKISYSSGITPNTGGMVISGGEEMIPHLKELGIRRGILMSGGEDPLLFCCNEGLRKAAAQYPETFSWMCNLDEKDPDTVEMRLSNYQKQGAVGVGEFAVNRWINSPFIEAVLTAAEHLKMPVLFHMSPEEGFNYGIADKPGLPLLEEALIRHPGLIFVGHSQPFWHEISAHAKGDLESRNSWGQGPVVPGGRLVTLMETYPNLYGDLSANSGGNAIMRDETMGLAFLERFQDRLMFGTDMCNTAMVFPLGGWLDEKLEQGVLSKIVYDKICEKNAQKVFGLE